MPSADNLGKEIDRLVRESIQWLDSIYSKDYVAAGFMGWFLSSPRHVQSFFIVGQMFHICSGTGGDPTQVDKQRVAKLAKSRLRALPELFGSLSIPSATLRTKKKGKKS